jgi:hypothetical protein
MRTASVVSYDKATFVESASAKLATNRFLVTDF